MLKTVAYLLSVDKSTKSGGNNFLLVLAGVLFTVVVLLMYILVGNQPDYTSLIQEAESNLVIESDSAIQNELNDERNNNAAPLSQKSDRATVETKPTANLSSSNAPDMAQSQISKNAPVSGGGKQHVVQRGETLFKIASMYGVSADAIKTANNLATDNLQIDQVLIIPSIEKSRVDKQPGTPQTHIVKSGEGLLAIARKYGVSLDELKKANQLTDDNIREGQELKIPAK